MALLKRWTDRDRLARAALGATLFSLAGCMIVNAIYQDEPKPFAFSHKTHVVDQGLGCTDCHRNTQKADEPGMPSPKQCALCHDDTDAEKPENERAAALFDGKTFKDRNPAALSDEIVFSHQKHALRDEDCNACHAGMDTNEVVSPGLALDMDACSACHVARGASNDCAVCHAEIRADVEPPSHAANWTKYHGGVVRACTGKTSDRCELCHKESDCASCHLEELPQNHTNYWRRRGHGFTASMDREGCATCHETDSCSRCHSEMEPLSHVGSFGGTRSNHCLGCHEPLRNEGCFVCHKSTPSHLLATPKPPGHNAAMNCRLCHGNGQPLPHADNGQNCNSCHL